VLGVICLDEYSFGLKLTLYPECELPRCHVTDLKVTGDGGGCWILLRLYTKISFLGCLKCNHPQCGGVVVVFVLIIIPL
jgi:hypothetical protein